MKKENTFKEYLRARKAAVLTGGILTVIAILVLAVYLPDKALVGGAVLVVALLVTIYQNYVLYKREN